MRASVALDIAEAARTGTGDRVPRVLASLLHDWFGWDSGSVLTNLIASAIWVIPTGVYAHRHFRCLYCIRPTTVPIQGTPHKSCKKHALEHGHVH